MAVDVDRGSALRTVELRVDLDVDFPLTLPHVSIAAQDVVRLGYPLNISARGTVCTFDPSTTTTNPNAPGLLVEACIRRAIDILEHVASPSDYDDEFLAYWEGRYPSEPAVDQGVLSLVNADPATGEPSVVTHVALDRPLGPYHSILFDRRDAFEPVRQRLSDLRIGANEEPTFFIGDLEIQAPPFSLQNRDVLRLIDRKGLRVEFQHYLRSGPERPLITFTRVVNGRLLLLGTRHQSLVPVASGRYDKRRAKKSRRTDLFSGRDAYAFAQRISPTVLTEARLQARTAADYSAGGDGGRYLVAGLGSVGSQLTGLLAASPWQSFYLVDPEQMALENLGRHHLGMRWINRPKVEGMKDFLLDKNPLRTVEAHDCSIAEALENSPDLRTTPDCYIVCTGANNTEHWLSDQQAEGRLDKPMIFVWVEPYVAAGHCVFLNGTDGKRLADLFYSDRGLYQHNAIAAAAHEGRSFTKREAGCQTTYQPYGNAPLTLFLSGILPYLHDILRDLRAESRRFRWIGDLNAIRDLGIALSADVERSAPGLVEVSLL